MCNDGPMGLAQTLQDDLVTAIKAGNETQKAVLRAVLTEIKTAETAEGANDPVSNDKVMAIISSEVKKRNEAAEIFQGAGETGRYQKEIDERNVLQTYLPEPLSQEELSALVSEVIADGGYSEKKDMGTVIKAVMAKASGRAEGRAVSAAVGQALS